MNSIPLPIYQARIVPALRRIQDEYGYLKRSELEQFAKQTSTPLHRLQAVASFFPHFRLDPGEAGAASLPTMTLRVCRDTACHMAGAEAMLNELRSVHAGPVRVEAVSCLGRCDRAPAACVTVHKAHASTLTNGSVPKAAAEAETLEPEAHADGHEGGDFEFYLLGRKPAEVKKVVEYLKGRASTPAQLAAAKVAIQPDHDIDQPYTSADWTIDPYKGPEGRDYAAVKKAVAVRDASLSKAAEILQTQQKWPRERTDRFRQAATRRLAVDFAVDAPLLDAVRAWQTDGANAGDEWAKGPEFGGWSDTLLAEFDDAHADLRGMGGAGIPSSLKWADVRNAVRTARIRKDDERAFIVVNGDESEPATFKDRELLLRSPHLIVEAVILAGLITDATQGFIYIRHEYHEQIEACREEIRRAEKLGVCGLDAYALGRPFPLSVFVSPGGYICGEQSALIEAMSDRRAEPRNMPPKLETNGLDDRPTLVSNVETFAWAPYILLKSGKAYAELGANGWRGRRFFSVCGDVERPGVYEVPMGMTLRELITGEQYCRGIKGGLSLKAFAPSGPSGGFLPAKLKAGAGLPRDHTNKKEWQALAARRGFDPAATELDILDMELELNLFRALSPTAALGAGLIVYAEGRDMTDQAVNAVEFFRNESCGKCVPCRTGSQKLAALGNNLRNGGIARKRWEEELLPLVRELGKVMELTSICGLGRSVPVPLRTVVEYFKEDLDPYLTGSESGTARTPVGSGTAEVRR